MMLHIDLEGVRELSKFPRESAKRDWAKLPNLITYSRLVATAYPAYLLVTGFHDPTTRWLAFIWFTIIASTDWVDGQVARRFNMRTEWGAFIDPLADKVLVATVLVVLCVSYAGHRLDWIVIGVSVFCLLRELILAWQIHRKNDTVPLPTWSGKVKTALQLAMIATWIAPDMPDWLVGCTTCFAVVATGASWIDYHRLYVSKTQV